MTLNCDTVQYHQTKRKTARAELTTAACSRIFGNLLQEQNVSWVPNSYSAARYIYRILRNTKILYHDPKSQLVAIL
jgi:hypothetical protein